MTSSAVPKLSDSEFGSFDEIDPKQDPELAWKAVKIPEIKPGDRKLHVYNASGQYIAYAIMDDQDTVRLYWGHGSRIDDQNNDGYANFEDAVPDLERNLRLADFEIWN